MPLILTAPLLAKVQYNQKVQECHSLRTQLGHFVPAPFATPTMLMASSAASSHASSSSASRSSTSPPSSRVASPTSSPSYIPNIASPLPLGPHLLNICDPCALGICSPHVSHTLGVYRPAQISTPSFPSSAHRYESYCMGPETSKFRRLPGRTYLIHATDHISASR